MYGILSALAPRTLIMATLLCTSKYRTLFGLPDDVTASPNEPNGLLGPWYANTLSIGPQRYLHYMSSRTLLPVVIWLRERRTAEERMRSALQHILAEMRVPDAIIAAETSALLSLAYDRATDRSHLGSMRDQTVTAKHMILVGPPLSPSELTMRLAEMPSGALKYRTPLRATAEILGAVRTRL